MLSARSVVLRRGAFRLAADAFDAPAGGLHALVGPNGAGKTTWLLVLCGALRPESGEVSAFGGPTGPPEVLYLPARPEDVLLGSDRRMEVEAGLDLLRQPRRCAAERLRAAEQLLDLPPERGDGQAERLYRALLGLVAQGPRALLLDEPTGRIGPEAKGWVQRALGRLSGSGCAVVVATHDPELVRSADAVSLVAGGKVVPASLQAAVAGGVLRAPELGRALAEAGWGDGALALDAHGLLRSLVVP